MHVSLSFNFGGQQVTGAEFTISHEEYEAARAAVFPPAGPPLLPTVLSAPEDLQEYTSRHATFAAKRQADQPRPRRGRPPTDPATLAARRAQARQSRSRLVFDDPLDSDTTGRRGRRPNSQFISDITDEPRHGRTRGSASQSSDPHYGDEPARGFIPDWNDYSDEDMFSNPLAALRCPLGRPTAGRDSTTTREITGDVLVPLLRPVDIAGAEHKTYTPPDLPWFNLESVSEFEQKELRLWFNGAVLPADSPALSAYHTARNFMILTYRRAPQTALTVSSCRRVLALDAARVLELFDFLVRFRLINDPLYVMPVTVPSHPHMVQLPPPTGTTAVDVLPPASSSIYRYSAVDSLAQTISDLEAAEQAADKRVEVVKERARTIECGRVASLLGVDPPTRENEVEMCNSCGSTDTLRAIVGQPLVLCESCCSGLGLPSVPLNGEMNMDLITTILDRLPETQSMSWPQFAHSVNSPLIPLLLLFCALPYEMVPYQADTSLFATLATAARVTDDSDPLIAVASSVRNCAQGLVPIPDTITDSFNNLLRAPVDYAVRSVIAAWRLQGENQALFSVISIAIISVVTQIAQRKAIVMLEKARQMEDEALHCLRDATSAKIDFLESINMQSTL